MVRSGMALYILREGQMTAIGNRRLLKAKNRQRPIRESWAIRAKNINTGWDIYRGIIG